MQIDGQKLNRSFHLSLSLGAFTDMPSEGSIRARPMTSVSTKLRAINSWNYNKNLFLSHGLTIYVLINNLQCDVANRICQNIKKMVSRIFCLAESHQKFDYCVQIFQRKTLSLQFFPDFSICWAFLFISKNKAPSSAEILLVTDLL
jgi:hypothetical protein